MWFVELTGFWCQENKYKDFLELDKHWERLLATTELVYLIFNAWRQHKVFKYPCIWLDFRLAFETFIDIVVNNIDTYKERRVYNKKSRHFQ